MDYIFTPWRYAYITAADRATSCIFCDRAPSRDANRENDERNMVIYRGQHCFVIANTFPYTSGHVMIVPYAHLDRLDLLPPEAAIEMMALAQRLETVLRDLYHPDGINLGMNIGKAAGAGVAGHIHMHVLPRWVADANFMSVIAETRVLPETPEVTARRIREVLLARAGF
jgi:ATP adenylyltransferase